MNTASTFNLQWFCTQVLIQQILHTNSANSATLIFKTMQWRAKQSSDNKHAPVLQSKNNLTQQKTY